MQHTDAQLQQQQQQQPDIASNDASHLHARELTTTAGSSVGSWEQQTYVEGYDAPPDQSVPLIPDNDAGVTQVNNAPIPDMMSTGSPCAMALMSHHTSGHRRCAREGDGEREKPRVLD